MLPVRAELKSYARVSYCYLGYGYGIGFVSLDCVAKWREIGGVDDRFQCRRGLRLGISYSRRKLTVEGR